MVLSVLLTWELVPTAARGEMGEEGKTSQPSSVPVGRGRGCFVRELCKAGLANR